VKKRVVLIGTLVFLSMLSGSVAAYNYHDLGLFPPKQQYNPMQPSQDFSYQFWLPPDLSNEGFRMELARRIAVDGFFRQFGTAPWIWPLIEETSWDATKNIATFSMTHFNVQGIITIEFVDPLGLAEPFGKYRVEAYSTAWDSPFIYRSTAGIVTKNRLRVWGKYQF